MKTKHFLSIMLILGLPGFVINAQSSRDREGAGNSSTGGVTEVNSISYNAAEIDLPIRRVSLLSSGVGFFEHSGAVASSQASAEVRLSFDARAVNDALKSLVISDPESASPSVRYAAENTLSRTLKSLKIDLSGTPGIGEILNSLKGAELEASAPNPIKGRIIGVEYRAVPVPAREQYGYPAPQGAEEAWLSLFTAEGIRVIAVKDISTFAFTDEKIGADLHRALDLIMASRDTEARNLLVNLNAGKSRDVSLSYVIPMPVWKVSYRLDLSGSAPFLQGWAIVDNDSDVDWKGVELSLIAGRPVSFIQNLYQPYWLSRPELPLAIAGIAESRTYESGYGAAAEYDAAAGAGGMPNEMRAMRKQSQMEEVAGDMVMYESIAASPAQAPRPAPVTGGVVETARAGAAGDQFEFTIKSPVTLERRQSAMLPLVEGTVKAEKTLVFSGSRAMGGATIHPALGAELTNTSGMKLPAGPITVYDGGTFAGDALIEFFPEEEKRLVSYGEDLSVTGNLTSSGTRYVTGVSVSGGVMTITRRQTFEKEYTIRNAGGEAKKLIIEHPITYGAELAEPKNADERTGNLYRFARNLGARETFVFKVREETPVSERVMLAQLRPESFLAYSTNQEIPANVRNALGRAIGLKKTADDAAAAQKELETRRQGFVTEQDRIRRNLEAAGNQTPQGQEYLRRLAALDGEIDGLTSRIDDAQRETQRAKKTYDDYVAAIKI